MSAPENCVPRLINVDKNPAYPATVAALKQRNRCSDGSGHASRKYLNNMLEQDHRIVKKLV